MSDFGDFEDNAPDGGYWDPNGSRWGGDVEADLPKSSADTGNITDSNVNSPLQTTGRPDASMATTSVTEPTTGGVNAPQISSRTATTKKNRLTVTVTNVETTKNGDPIVTLDVTTTLPRFHSSSYRGIKRTHSEIRKFANHLSSATPECFVPVLPPPITSFPAASPENVNQIKTGLQKWFNRITRSPLLARDEEFIYFVEYKSAYTPVVKIKPPATGLARKVIKQRAPPEDNVEELHSFRPLAKLVYQYAVESHGRTQRVARSRKLLGAAHTELSQRVAAMVQVETQKGMINMWTKLSKVLATVGDIESTKATLLDGYFGDALQMMARDSYAIKETLTNRHILMRDLVKCQADSAARHETATRLKGANSISPAKVDEAITQLEDAKQLERKVTSAVRRVTDNLVVEKSLALNRMETDLLNSVAQYTVRTIDADRRILSVWESIRRDVRAVDARGGLSKLGREGTTRHSQFSQAIDGDTWSGDRIVRAKDIVHASAADEVIDAKSAASLLSSVYE